MSREFETATLETAAKASRATAKPLEVLAAFLAGVGVTFFRRPNQFSQPAVWVEEGTVILQEWIAEGLPSAFNTLNGTFPIPTRLLLGLNLELFPVQWQWANVLTATAVIGMTSAMVIGLPLAIRWRWMVLGFLLLAPLDSEVFGVGSYTFWWFSLWSLLAVLWSPSARGQPGRVVLAWIGALASPTGAAFALLGWVRCLVTRSRSDVRFALWATPPAIWTIVAVMTSGMVTSLTPMDPADLPQLPYEIATRFFGFWVWTPTGPTATAGHLFLGVILVCVVLLAGVLKVRAWTHSVLLGALVASIGAVIVRVDPTIIHPIVAGPRYFFHAFVVLGILIVQIVATSSGNRLDSLVRGSAVLLVAIAALNVAGLAAFESDDLPPTMGFQRHHVSYDWERQLESCASGAPIEVLFDGSDVFWQVEVSPEWCSTVLSEHRQSS